MKIKHGSVTLSITPCTIGIGGKRYRYHRVRYKQDGQLHRPIFKTEILARAFADKKAIELANGRTAAHNLTPEDAASHARARQLLTAAGITKPLELVISEYCHLISAKTPDPRYQTPFPAVVTDFLAHKERDGTRWRQRADLKQRLEQIQPHFQCPLAALTAADFTRVLDTMQAKHQWANRTRNHMRAALSNLAGFARGRYVPREWDEIRHVEKFKEADGKIVIWTPEDADLILNTAREHLPKAVPALVTMFFIGHRQSETTGTPQDDVPPLDWTDLNLTAGTGFLEEGKVRTAGNRITHIPHNAQEWLKNYAQPSGPICPYKNFNNVIKKITAKAGIPWKKNACRRSYISYRLAQTKNLPLVSEETGTSITTLQRRYRRPVELTVAEKYFNILPPIGTAVKLPRLKSQKTAKNARAAQPAARHETAICA